MAGTDQFTVYYVRTADDPAPTDSSGVRVLVTACPDCGALVAAPNMEAHQLWDRSLERPRP